MNLDEQIAWLEQQACNDLGEAKMYEAQEWPRPWLRERAATLLTIENTLRAMRDEKG